MSRFKVGDVVCLDSTGVKMIVEQIWNNGDSGTVRVGFSVDGNDLVAFFPARFVKMVKP